MRHIPSFTLLRAFEAAARLRSFTLAAQELHLTPSAISHQIKDLETHVGRKLFVRRGRTVEPTPEAVRLAATLGRVLDVVEAACDEVKLAPREQILTVHCAPSFAVKWLGPRCASFAEAFPEVTMRLSTGAEPLDLTRAQEVDVAISYGAGPERPSVEGTSLGAERIAPLCSPMLIDEGLSARRQIGRLTLIESQMSPVTWADWFEVNDLELPRRPRPSFDRAALAISAAVDGMGVALESARLARRELERGELVELGAGTFTAIEHDLHFLAHRRSARPPAKVRAFRDWLLDELGLVAVSRLP
jgi:DNA-binding transcriptional LysR family regulator